MPQASKIRTLSDDPNYIKFELLEKKKGASTIFCQSVDTILEEVSAS